MKINLLLCLPLILLIPTNCLNAQEYESTAYGSQTITKEVTSKENKAYNLLITLPPNYNQESKYKTLYYLDAWWLSEMVRGNYAIQYLTEQVEPMILVGISAIGEEWDWHRQRNMDYTPSYYDQKKMRFAMKGGPIPLDSSSTGGGETFMAFLQSKVLPFVEGSYASDPKSRGILGHSLGGLFGFYALTHYPDVFQHYILISPALWWNRSELLVKERLEALEGNFHIYLAVGEAEAPIMKKPFLNSVEMIKDLEKSGIKLSVDKFEGLNHHSILPTAIFKGLKEAY